eukprot:TRINITY_DN81104_c0_g1_i1.p1 TRINITY_DN81104_c0_g1~~TRINITY_DN81104_c0_g1_i1.p1  ORF type:complete len:442 (-),score=68.01 TRINITY_DN81104_c0_g1_i1:92-1417(-)
MVVEPSAMKCSIAFLIPLASCVKLYVHTQQQVELSEVQNVCEAWHCSKGWHFNIEKASAPGASDAECCVKTCFFHKCGEGFHENSAYFGNVGQTDNDCCDKTCAQAFADAAYECNSSHYPSKDPTKVGISAAQCCEQSCDDFKCKEGWFVDEAKRNNTGMTDEACCSTRCSELTCKADGWLLRDETLNKVTDNWEDCCTKTCMLLGDCPVPIGFDHPLTIRYPDLRESDVDACCFPQCRHHTCSKGLAKDVSKDDHFDPSDESCCFETCGVFECPLGFSLDVEKAMLLGNTQEECCLPACGNSSMCDLTAGWAPKPDVEDKVYDKHETCCLKTCSRHQCPTNYTVPNVTKDVVMASPDPDEYCCEPVKCRDYRTGSTPLEGDKNVCNKIAQAECARHYMQVKEGDIERLMFMSCRWDEELGICRLNDQAEDVARGCLMDPN